MVRPSEFNVNHVIVFDVITWHAQEQSAETLVISRFKASVEC